MFEIIKSCGATRPLFNPGCDWNGLWRSLFLFNGKVIPFWNICFSPLLFFKTKLSIIHGSLSRYRRTSYLFKVTSTSVRCPWKGGFQKLPKNSSHKNTNGDTLWFQVDWQNLAQLENSLSIGLVPNFLGLNARHQCLSVLSSSRDLFWDQRVKLPANYCNFLLNVKCSLYITFNATYLGAVYK